jgi:hypothetical protein
VLMCTRLRRFSVVIVSTLFLAVIYKQSNRSARHHRELNFGTSHFLARINEAIASAILGWSSRIIARASGIISSEYPGIHWPGSRFAVESCVSAQVATAPVLRLRVIPWMIHNLRKLGHPPQLRRNLKRIVVAQGVPLGHSA